MSKKRKNYHNTWQYKLKKWMELGYSDLDNSKIEDLVGGSKPQYPDHGLAEFERREKSRAHRYENDMKNEEELYDKLIKWSDLSGNKLIHKIYAGVSILLCISIIFFLLLTVIKLPVYGLADKPSNNEVPQRYIENGIQETGAVNVVTGMILDYRAFDTLGESTVLFIAACSVLVLLRLDKTKDGKPKDEHIAEESDDRHYEPKNDIILQRSTFLLFPAVIIFGIYVILNGHLSPGGGFSGGAIIGAGLIMYLNAYGFKKTERFFTYKTYKRITFGALMFYAAAKSYSFYTGANHLPSGIPLGVQGDILSSGLILPLNICVGMVVACTIYAFYTMFRKGGM